jgi:hypothetical protein
MLYYLGQKEIQKNGKTDMNKKTNNAAKFLAFILAVVLLFTISAVISGKIARKKALEKAEKEKAKVEQQEAEEEKEAEEAAKKSGELDKFSMQKYCHDNAMAVFKALKAGDAKKLRKLMVDPKDIETVMDFADWSTAEFEEAVSMGSGSLTAEPDKDGKMDESERFFVNAGGSRYVFFIETLTSSYGRKNDGVSAIGVTTFDHFDATDYVWNGELDDYSALAGELFWNQDRTEEEEPAQEEQGETEETQE